MPKGVEIEPGDWIVYKGEVPRMPQLPEMGTLRDYFAGEAISSAVEIVLEGIKSDNPELCEASAHLAKTAKLAYNIADAMLAERDKKKED